MIIGDGWFLNRDPEVTYATALDLELGKAPTFPRLRFQPVQLGTDVVVVQTDGPPATWEECDAADRLARRDPQIRNRPPHPSIPLVPPGRPIDHMRRAIYTDPDSEPNVWALRAARAEGAEQARAKDRLHGMPLAVALAFFAEDKETQDVLLDAFEQITGKRPTLKGRL